MCPEKQESIGGIVFVLRKANPAFLASALLASLKSSPGCSRLRRATGELTRWSRGVWERVLAAIRSPLHWSERLWCIPLHVLPLLPLPLMMPFIIVHYSPLGVVLTCYFLFMGLPTFRYDCLRVLPSLQADLTHLRQWLLAALAQKEREGFPAGSFLLENGRIRDTVLAQEILLSQGPKNGAVADLPIGTARALLLRLLRQRLLGDRCRAVLALMGDRRLLSEAIDVGQTQWRATSVRSLSLHDHEEQLRRVLPFAPAWGSFALTAILGLIGTTLWLVALRWMAPIETAMGAWHREVVCLLPLCVLLTALQYSLRWLGALKMLGAVVSVLLYALYLWSVGKEGTWGSHLCWAATVILTVMTITNFLVPELLARLRGANLLYPTAHQLWLQRLLWPALTAGACLLLAPLTVALARYLAWLGEIWW
jgi:hypothetical protein